MKTKQKTRRTKTDEKVQQDVIEQILEILECTDLRINCDNVVHMSPTYISRFFDQMRSGSRTRSAPIQNWGVMFGGKTMRESEFSLCRTLSITQRQNLCMLRGFKSEDSIVRVDTFCVDNITGHSAWTKTDYFKSDDSDPACPWIHLDDCVIDCSRPYHRISGQRYQTGFKTLQNSAPVPTPMFANSFESLSATMWSVKLSAFGGTCKLRYFTDDAGVSHFFRLRDLPEDQQRRAALMHWVREHGRRIKTGSIKQIAGHLRGREEFRWGGFFCEVIPPASLTNTKDSDSK